MFSYTLHLGRPSAILDTATDNAVDYTNDHDAPTHWVHAYGQRLGEQNLTFLDTVEEEVTTPILHQDIRDTVKNDHTSDLQDEICMRAGDIAVLKGTLCLFLESVIGTALEADCYGCLVNHPSQLQHSCLFEPCLHYFEIRFDVLCDNLFKPTLAAALSYALKNLCSKDISTSRILGAADAIVHELKSEPYILEKLKEIIALFLTDAAQPTVTHCLKLWLGDCPNSTV